MRFRVVYCLVVIYLLALCPSVVGSGPIALRKPHAILQQGIAGPYQWRVLVHRNSTSETARHRPCIDASIGQKPSPVGAAPVNSVCGAVAPYPDVIGAAIGSGNQTHTLIAFAYGRNIQKLFVDLGSRGTRWLRLQLTSNSKARLVGIDQFRFASLVLVGRYCVRRLQGYGKSGKLAADSGPQQCG